METSIKGWINCNSGASTNLFCNSRKSIIYSQLTVTDTSMFVFDSTATSFAVNNVKTSALSYYSCAVSLSNSRTYNPFYQPNIGRITFNETEYFTCTVTKLSATSLVSFLPAMFTMEAWFRLDPIDLRPNGYIS